MGGEGTVIPRPLGVTWVPTYPPCSSWFVLRLVLSTRACSSWPKAPCKRFGSVALLWLQWVGFQVGDTSVTNWSSLWLYWWLSLGDGNPIPEEKFYSFSAGGWVFGLLHREWPVPYATIDLWNNVVRSNTHLSICTFVNTHYLDYHWRLLGRGIRSLNFPLRLKFAHKALAAMVIRKQGLCKGVFHLH